MSLETTINLIIGELPAPLAEAVRQALSTNNKSDHLQIHRFCISRMTNIPYMRFLSERRLMGCDSVERERFYKARLAFLDESIAASMQGTLLHGWWTVEDKSNSFLIDDGRKVFCIGPAP